MKTRQYSKLIAVAAIAGALAGCVNHASSAEPEKKTTEKTYMKPGAAVSFSANGVKQVAIGDTVTIAVNVNENYQTGSMSIDITSDDSVEISPASSNMSLDLSGTNTHSIDVTFTAMAQGRQYINFIASIDADGSQSSRAQSIAVQVGDPAQNQKKVTAGETVTTATGETLIIMDAEETIQ